MTTPPLKIPRAEYQAVRASIESTITNGGEIRNILGNQTDGSPANTLHWEVRRAEEALHVFGSRWTTEILTARRFNQMKNLLQGISSRTLSDKLRFLVEEGLVHRQVQEGPPVRVSYVLSEHGRTCGRLLSPLVAHLKIHAGMLLSDD